MSSKQQSPSKLFVMLPMLYLVGKVDLTSPLLLNSARAAFLTMQVIALTAAYFIKTSIEKKKDMKKIYVRPPPKSPFATDEVVEYEPTTYYEHELAKANEFMKQTAMGAGISSLIHFYFGVNQVVVIQSVMIPMNLFENVLVRAYVLGWKSERMWDEKFEGEDLSTPVVEGASTDGAKKIEANAEGKKAADMTIADHIAVFWDAAEKADVDTLLAAAKKSPNKTTSTDGWGALHVMCGSPVDTDGAIKELIKAGADVCKADNDGWTALHWACFHDRPEAAKIVLESASPKQVARLLELEATDGRTAKQVAVDEKNDDVVEVLKSFTDEASSADSSAEKTDSEGLRQRKK